MKNVRIIIPAFRCLSVFNNDLLVKVSGKAVVEHLLEKCKLVVRLEDLFVFTDSEEIDLLCTRSEVKTVFFKPEVKLKFDFKCLVYLNDMLLETGQDIALISPYALFFEIDALYRAKKTLEAGYFVRPIKKLENEVYVQKEKTYTANEGLSDSLFKVLNTFILASANPNEQNRNKEKNIVIENAIDFELKSRHDFWVYERLINRKKIIFNVAASKEIGMGHVYRAISLAHEIIEHEVVFVCDDESSLAVKALSEHEYPLYVSSKNTIVECIKNLDPMLVINDFLDTEKSYIESLKAVGIKTINFEDFGTGAKLSDYTINDLYDSPLYQSENTLWGYKYFFVRDEFYSAIKNPVKSTVKGVLLTFGGTDQNNFTQKFYKVIKQICKLKGIKIFVVTGEGYSGLEDFGKELSSEAVEDVEFIHKTGVMSKIMENVQVAISSNGRTVYELAHMNIPAIVVSHHERENNHKFSCLENGFINLGCYEAGATETRLLSEFTRLISESECRNNLAAAMVKFSFVENKNTINNIISSLINK